MSPVNRTVPVQAAPAAAALLPTSIDALLPADMAARAEAVGVKKAGLPVADTFVLAILAGAFIALGALFATTAGAGFAGSGWPVGLQRFIMGLAFCLGLILVVVGGAELFTGNNLVIMAWAGRRIATARLLRNWGIVYAGNLVGAVGTAVLVFAGGHYAMQGGAPGLHALAIAESKSALTFVQAFALGILCNGLVCLAVWLTYSARSTTDKIMAILFPITAFVAAAQEHSVANMYFLPYAMLVKAFAPASFWSTIGKSAGDYPHIGWQGLVGNLIPVTLGNIVGGAILVGAVYWWLYLRHRTEAA